MQDTHYWVVDGGDPKPEPYITVIAPGYQGKMAPTHILFDTQAQALDRARELRQLYGVSRIRIFYPVGCSRLIK